MAFKAHTESCHSAAPFPDAAPMALRSRLGLPQLFLRPAPALGCWLPADPGFPSSAEAPPLPSPCLPLFLQAWIQRDPPGPGCVSIVSTTAGFCVLLLISFIPLGQPEVSLSRF